MRAGKDLAVAFGLQGEKFNVEATAPQQFGVRAL
jgi:hypothetical protein